MRAVITGVAGFVGSHLAETLLERGDEVVGVDCFTGYYDTDMKRSNLEKASSQRGFTFHEADLREADISALLAGAEVLFHQAAQPGVRHSWSDGFPDYDTHNVLVTQRLLEAARDSALQRFVYASSSSVYGDAERYPTMETDLPKPASPYGVTKLAAEHLCNLYAKAWDVPTVSLRYFTVYGPRQRPDMAFHRLIEAGLAGTAFPLFGDGSQVRDFTFVSDVVKANVLAADSDLEPGSVLNVSGGSSSSLSEAIAIVEEHIGTAIELDRRPKQPGDVAQTGGSSEAAQRILGWKPEVTLTDGLKAQVEWHRERRAG